MSQFFTSGGQSIGASASASVLPMNFQGWFSLGLIGLISLLSKELSRVYPTLQFKSRDIILPTKVHLVNAMVSLVVMYGCESGTIKKSWAPKNWCFWTVVLEKTLESPLESMEIKSVNPKGNQPWTFIAKTDAETEAPILWCSAFFRVQLSHLYNATAKTIALNILIVVGKVMSLLFNTLTRSA